MQLRLMHPGVLVGVSLVSLVSCDAIGLKHSKVPSNSMTPTYSRGDRIWWQELNQDELKGLKVGEVVVYRDPSISPDPLLKRVVGLAGDVVEIRGTLLLVNGANPSAAWATRECAKRPCDFGPVTVPPDHVFVLGDNWEMSSDSRNTGPVPRGSVVGKVVS